MLGLWKGVGPTCGRATVLAAAELSTYDEVKTQLLHRGIFSSEGLPLTVCTAFCSGYVSTVASSPFDVVADHPLPRAGAMPRAARCMAQTDARFRAQVKSRVMGQPLNPDGSPSMYSGMMDCFVKSAKSEGIFSLYNGFWPNFGRVVPRVVIVFVVMEQLKSNFG